MITTWGYESSPSPGEGRDDGGESCKLDSRTAYSVIARASDAIRSHTCEETWGRVLAARFARVMPRISTLLECRGYREGRVAAAPGAPAQRRIARAREPQVQAETLRPSLRSGFTAYFVLFSVNRCLFATVVLAALLEHSRDNLAPAWARQDHTTSPSANMPYVYRHVPVHCIPLHVRDDAYAPCVGAERANYRPILVSGKQKYFWHGSLTGFL